MWPLSSNRLVNCVFVHSAATGSRGENCGQVESTDVGVSGHTLKSATLKFCTPRTRRSGPTHASSSVDLPIFTVPLACHTGPRFCLMNSWEALVSRPCPYGPFSIDGDIEERWEKETRGFCP